MKNWKEDIKKLIRLSMTADSLQYMKIRVSHLVHSYLKVFKREDSIPIELQSC